jgi:hypothetical protein
MQVLKFVCSYPRIEGQTDGLDVRLYTDPGSDTMGLMPGLARRRGSTLGKMENPERPFWGCNLGELRGSAGVTMQPRPWA